MASRHLSASARCNSVYMCNNVWTSKEELKASSYTKTENPACIEAHFQKQKILLVGPVSSSTALRCFLSTSEAYLKKPSQSAHLPFQAQYP